MRNPRSTAGHHLRGDRLLIGARSLAAAAATISTVAVLVVAATRRRVLCGDMRIGSSSRGSGFVPRGLARRWGGRFGALFLALGAHLATVGGRRAVHVERGLAPTIG